MFRTLRFKIGAIIFDASRFYALLFASKITGQPRWKFFSNRNEKIQVNSENFGVKCNWRWTSEIHLSNMSPRYGRKLLNLAITAHPIRFSQYFETANSDQEITFIIGHRGSARLPLLLKTIESIGGQEDCSVACIVVEQSTRESIKSQLPDWVTYQHQPVREDQPYSRAAAFNAGAKLCKSSFVILHDNDLVVPSCYASEHLALFKKGYSVVNLKRFIFYLNQSDTESLLAADQMMLNLTPQSIMQNAQGGGSVGICKQSFSEIGGFDEQFTGWGGEDNEFWDRALTKKTWEYAHLPLVHLWHEAQKEKSTSGQTVNTVLYESLNNIPVEQRIEQLKRKYSGVGL